MAVVTWIRGQLSGAEGFWVLTHGNFQFFRRKSHTRKYAVFWWKVSEWFFGPSCRVIDGITLENTLKGAVYPQLFHLELLGYSSLQWWLLNELPWQDPCDKEEWWLGSWSNIKECQGNEWSWAQNHQLFSHTTGRQFERKDAIRVSELTNPRNVVLLCSFTYRVHFLEMPQAACYPPLKYEGSVDT